MNIIKTAECVTPKHPDKLCDQISDAILDACLEQDKDSRVAIEVMGGHGIITITGELTTNAYINMREIAQRVAGNYGVQINVVKQSNEIAQGVDNGGAGDQGIMVGYACNDNEEMIPQELYLARSLCKYIYERYPYDGKTQITLNSLGGILTIVVSFQNVSKEDLRKCVADWSDANGTQYQNYNCYCNPAGNWTQGGFEADTGLTGRKLAVDNYGPQIPIGGGAFSGKDASKVDRSGAYMARKIAVDLLKEHNAKEVMVKLAYAIGIAEPVMATAEIDGKTIEIEEDKYTPKYIIETLELKKPQYEELAKWGHFGRNTLWR